MPKIFIADDDPLSMRLYEKLLEHGHYEVLKAQDGQEAFDALDSMKTKPDLIILDIMMPKINGLELLGGIKQDARLMHIPVIMLTNLAGKDSEGEKAIALGAAWYFVKDQSTLEELVKKIDALIAAAAA